MSDSPDDLPPVTLSTDGLPRITKRIVDAGCDILEIDVDSPTYMHAVLCQVGMPRSKQKERTFHRSSGNCSILLEAGSVPTPFGKWQELPLPYGVKPRLVMQYMCTQAVQTNSRFITMDDSMTKFLERLKINACARGRRNFKAQMTALTACHMTIGFAEIVGRSMRMKQVKVDPVSAFDAWLPLDMNQPALWDDHIELGDKFYETLREHAVPLDPRALAALKHSALCLDIYTWLAHRLCRVRKQKGVKLSWRNLREQFGQEYKCSKEFKKEFKKSLFKVRAVYPHADIEEAMGGIILKPSPPPIKKTNVLVSLPKG